jgi:hypothetical protein
LLLGLGLTMAYDVYFIVDRDRKQILRYRRILKLATESAFRSFSQLAGVTTSGLESSGIGQKGPDAKHWSYCVQVICNDGKKIRVRGWKKSLEEIEKAARTMSVILDTRHIKGQPRKHLRVTAGGFNRQAVIEHLDPSVYKPPWYQDTVVMFMGGVLAILAVMIWMFLKIML